MHSVQHPYVKFYLKELPNISATKAALTTPRIICKLCRFNEQPVIWWTSCPRLAQVQSSSENPVIKSYNIDKTKEERFANKYTEHSNPALFKQSGVKTFQQSISAPMHNSEINVATPSPPPPPTSKRMYYHRSFSGLPLMDHFKGFDSVNSTASAFPQKDTSALNTADCKRCLGYRSQHNRLQKTQCNCKAMVYCKHHYAQQHGMQCPHFYHPTQQLYFTDCSQLLRQQFPPNYPSCRCNLTPSNIDQKFPKAYCPCKNLHQLQSHDTANKCLLSSNQPTLHNASLRQCNHYPFYG